MLLFWWKVKIISLGYIWFFNVIWDFIVRLFGIWLLGVYFEDSKILRLIIIFVRSCFNLEFDDF